MKRGVLLIVLLILIILGLECIGQMQIKGNLVVVFCDVGQGDGALIKTPKGQDILVDVGPDSKILKCISSYLPFWDRKIDLIILSHFNTDHVAGLIDILSRYKVERIAVSTLNTDREDVGRYMQLIRTKNIILDDLNKNDTYKIEQDLTIKTFGPNDEKYLIEDNNASLVQMLTYKDFDVVFTGDASFEVLNPILDGLGNDIEILKVPHHGSKTGLNEGSFRNFHPKVAVISSGKGNRYGHPTKEILNLLQENKIQVRRTDKEGSVRFVVD